MNIFVLDQDPVVAAKYHCDKHMKMATESTQMLFTNYYLTGRDVSTCPPTVKDTPRRPNHQNHPCTIWARTSQQNYDWLIKLAYALCDEHLKRYNKFRHDLHAIDWLYWHSRGVFPDIGLTPFAQAMPDVYKHPVPEVAYRKFYLYDKARFAKWKNSLIPDWYRNPLPSVILL